MAIQHYMQEDPQLEIRWVRSPPERRKEMMGWPVMMDPKLRYQDKAMRQYWTQRDHQVGHDIIYQGSSTYMMYTVGQLRYSRPRQRARKVKLLLDWGVHGRRMQLM